jgi:hypothetical protein
MSRQSSFKIILTTVIFLIIGLIGIFTYVNWSEIKKKFENAQAKSENIERHERTTVTASNPNNLITPEEVKSESVIRKEETKEVKSLPIEPNSSVSIPSAKPIKKTELKEPEEYGLNDSEPKNETKILNKNNIKKEVSKKELAPEKEKFAYPNGTEKDSAEKVTSFKGKKISSKKTSLNKKKSAKKNGSRKIKNLEKRVATLEKKIGLKKKTKKKASLEKRVTRLEKIVKKK